MEAPLVSGIAFNRNEASLTILGVPDRPTVAAQILNPISDANIDVDMIVQNTLGDGTADFTFTVNRDDYRRARALLEETASELGPPACRATVRSPRFPSSESGCGTILASPAPCSRYWARRGSTCS